MLSTSSMQSSRACTVFCDTETKGTSSERNQHTRFKRSGYLLESGVVIPSECCFVAPYLHRGDHKRVKTKFSRRILVTAVQAASSENESPGLYNCRSFGAFPSLTCADRSVLVIAEQLTWRWPCRREGATRCRRRAAAARCGRA